MKAKAAMEGKDPEALASANGITVDELGNLQIGQELLIPSQ